MVEFWIQDFRSRRTGASSLSYFGNYGPFFDVFHQFLERGHQYSLHILQIGRQRQYLGMYAYMGKD
jgi:hypothetical protein